MNAVPAVRNLPFDVDQATDFAPTKIDHRTKGSGLKAIAADFMHFPTEGVTDPWTVKYEEVLYVIAGSATVHHIEGDNRTEVKGNPGDVIAIQKGTTVQYGGTAGTQIFLALTPANWRDLEN